MEATSLIPKALKKPLNAARCRHAEAVNNMINNMDTIHDTTHVNRQVDSTLWCRPGSTAAQKLKPKGGAWPVRDKDGANHIKDSKNSPVRSETTSEFKRFI